MEKQIFELRMGLGIELHAKKVLGIYPLSLKFIQSLLNNFFLKKKKTFDILLINRLIAR